MARIWYDAAGVILRFAHNDAEEARYGAPSGSTGSIAFDEAANPSVVSGLDTAWGQHDCVGGVLRRNASAVSITADLPATTLSRGKYLGAVRLTANRQSTVTGLADVTGLSLALDPNSNYAFSFTGAYTAGAATTGISLAVNGPASPSLVRVVGSITESATTIRNGVAAAYDTAIAGLNSGGATAMPFWIEGNISTGAAGGSLTLRFASEVSASAVTVLAGSWGELKKVG